MRTNTTNAILQYVPGRFQRVASTHGGEWAGPCPWCKGTDRFRIWPNRDPYAIVYWCRQCGKHGDVIQFLREKEGLSFGEACAKAGQLPVVKFFTTDTSGRRGDHSGSYGQLP